MKNEVGRVVVGVGAVVLLQQPVSADTSQLFEMSLEDLLNIKVVSATRQEDEVSQAPVAISIVTRAQLERSSVTNISEALRLLPGVIVREKANGLYDISIRGLSGMPPGNGPAFSSDSSTLVMVDEQPIYNHFSGGVFWPSIGLSIQDIERIEVVRGPASALFGPNAANGVIHIITRNVEQIGWTGQVNLEAGENEQRSVHVRSNFRNKNLESVVYGNFESRDKETSDYYSFQQQNYLPSSDVFVLGTNVPLEVVSPNAFPDDELAYESNTVGVRVKKSSAFGKTTIKVDHNQSDFHDTNLDNASTLFVIYDNESYRYELKHEYEGWSGSYIREKTEQDLAIGTFLDYTMRRDHFQLQHDKSFGELNLNVLLEASKVKTDSSDFLGANSNQNLSYTALATHLDYRFSDRWRFVGALRLDDFSIRADKEESYQFSLSSDLSDRSYFWILHGKAFRSPFVLDSFTQLDTFEIDNVFSRFEGNEELDLLTIHESQIGYRYRVKDTFSVNVELFDRRINNFSSLFFQETITEGTSTVLLHRWDNLMTESDQVGGTLSLDWQLSKFLLLTGHFTYQKTDLMDRQDVAGLPALYPPYDQNFKGNPSWFGGLNLYWTVSDKTQIGFDSYYFSKHTPEYGYGFTVGASIPVNIQQEIPQKTLLNMVVNYQYSTSIDLKLLVNNLSDDTDNEFLYSDPVGRSIAVAATLNW